MTNRIVSQGTFPLFLSGIGQARDLPVRFFVLTHRCVMGLDESGELGEMDGLNSFRKAGFPCCLLLGPCEPTPKGQGLGCVPRYRCGLQLL